VESRDTADARLPALTANGAAADPPAVLAAAGPAARFAWEEFLLARLRNHHTRRAYTRAVARFLKWCESREIALQQVSPPHVGLYMDELPVALPTKKQHLAALRHFFDQLVIRHAVMLNPAASVRGERYQVVEGKTPEITVDQARKLLRSIDCRHVVGLRDRAIVGILIYTAARVGAVAKLRIGDYFDAGDQYCLRFTDKGGKCREIPVRHDLQQFLASYLAAVRVAPIPEGPLFRTAIRRTKQLTDRAMTATDMGRMVKRRIRDAGLPPRLSPHSCRVATITNLLAQGLPLEDVQNLAGHADPRTTRLYDRRQRRVTRNIVERISI
jgi:site-specific recombinase XerD